MKKLILSLLVCLGLLGCVAEQPVYAQTNCVQYCGPAGCQVVCSPQPGYWYGGVYYAYPVGYRGYHGYGYRGGYGHGGYHGGRGGGGHGRR